MMARKRIIHLISSLDSGGAENMLLRTLPLLGDGFDHVVITLLRPGVLAQEFEAKGIRTVDIGLHNLVDIRSFRKLLTQVSQLEPALVITYLFYADVIGRLYLQRRISTPVIPFLRSTYNYPRYWPARIFAKFTKHLVPRYFANSDAVRTYYAKHIGVSADNITVIPNGIDLTVFDHANGDRIVRELKLPRRRFVVSCVANFAKNKGHRLLLEAFKQFHRSHPEAWLLLVGTGEELEKLKQQILPYASRQQILFLGRRKDVPDILAASDAFVFPTLFEGMPNAVLEAMAAGLPVITTDIPENRVLITNRKNGILVEPAQSLPIQEALEALITDTKLRDQLGQRARETIEERFAIPRVLVMWRQALQEFSSPSSGGGG